MFVFSPVLTLEVSYSNALFLYSKCSCCPSPNGKYSIAGQSLWYIHRESRQLRTRTCNTVCQLRLSYYFVVFVQHLMNYLYVGVSYTDSSVRIVVVVGIVSGGNYLPHLKMQFLNSHRSYCSRPPTTRFRRVHYQVSRRILGSASIEPSLHDELSLLFVAPVWISARCVVHTQHMHTHTPAFSYSPCVQPVVWQSLNGVADNLAFAPIVGISSCFHRVKFRIIMAYVALLAHTFVYM